MTLHLSVKIQTCFCLITTFLENFSDIKPPPLRWKSVTNMSLLLYINLMSYFPFLIINAGLGTTAFVLKLLKQSIWYRDVKS